VLVTSEHGGHEVPEEYRALFRGHANVLASHRGWDPGTLSLARDLSERLGAPLVAATHTRLLVDLNRSPHNPRVFSRFTKPLPREGRARLLERFHRPHWEAVQKRVGQGIASGSRVLHLGVHSFTPALDGVARKPDLALLYDPARPTERALAAAWTQTLTATEPSRAFRRNDPYRGSADGLTTALRRDHADERYLGLEIEVNQKHVGRSGGFPPWVRDLLVTTLSEVLATLPA